MLTARDDTAPTEQGRRRVEAALALAHRVLADRDEPDQGDQVRRVVDPDARCGTHGPDCAGYLLDSSGAADSDLLTALNLLPGNGDAARDTQTRLAAEPRAPGTTVAAGSIDGRGWNGEVLRALSAPQGVGVEVYGPPPAPEETPFFPPAAFVLEAQRGVGLCPGGQQTATKERRANGSGGKFVFARRQGAGCARHARCLATLPQKKGGVSSSMITRRSMTPRRNGPRRRHTRRCASHIPGATASWPISCGTTTGAAVGPGGSGGCRSSLC